MRLFLFLLFNSTLFVLNSHAQVPQIEWEKSLGGTSTEVASCILQTNDRGYIVAGITLSNDGDVTENHGQNDEWIVKLDSTGNMQWQASLGGSNQDKAKSVKQTYDGGYIVCGYTASNDGEVSGNHGYYDYWLVKLNSTGNIQWQKCLGGSLDDLAYSIQITRDSGYVMAGKSKSYNGDLTANHGGYDYWIIKTDDSGSIQWQKSYGGTNDDIAQSILQTSDGGYIVAGTSESNDGDVTGHHGNDSTGDYWVVKLDNTGTIQWQKSLGGTVGDTASSIQKCSDGGYIVAGYTYSNDSDVTGNHGSSDYWVVKLDSIGTLVWQKCFGGTLQEVSYSIVETSDGGNLIAGYSYSNDGDVSGHHGISATADSWVVKTDAVGNIQWQKSLGGTSDEINTVYSNEQTADGGYILACTSASNDDDVTEHWKSRFDPSSDPIQT